MSWLSSVILGSERIFVYHLAQWAHRDINDWHDGVIKWKDFPRYWPCMRRIHRSPVNSPHKGQWRGALMFSYICALNKQLRKQSWGWWFETPSRSLWGHCNVISILKIWFRMPRGFTPTLWINIALWCHHCVYMRRILVHPCFTITVFCPWGQVQYPRHRNMFSKISVPSFRNN